MCASYAASETLLTQRERNNENGIKHLGNIQPGSLPLEGNKSLTGVGSCPVIINLPSALGRCSAKEAAVVGCSLKGVINVWYVCVCCLVRFWCSSGSDVQLVGSHPVIECVRLLVVWYKWVDKQHVPTLLSHQGVKSSMKVTTCS